MAKTESTLTALIGINKAQILRVQIKIEMYLNYNRLNVDLSTWEGHFHVEMLKRHARNTAEILRYEQTCHSRGSRFRTRRGTMVKA